MNGLITPTWYDSILDVEVEWDAVFAWVARVLPQYTIADLRRMKIHKFYRLIWKAEEKQKEEIKRARG